MPNEKKEPKSYTVSLPADPVQRDVEQFQAARRKFGSIIEAKYGIETAGEFVRAAADLGWIEGLTAEDVGDMRVPVVTQLSSPIADWINEALKLPGE